VASVNLANHLAMKGQTGEAIVLWEEALSRNSWSEICPAIASRSEDQQIFKMRSTRQDLLNLKPGQY